MCSPGSESCELQKKEWYKSYGLGLSLSDVLELAITSYQTID